MKTLFKLFRVLFGLTFIISGFTKLIDPVGTGLVVKEYFSFMHLGFLSPLANEFGITMSALEMLTGICVFSGLFLKLFTFIGMAMMAAFTLVTVYLVAYNPISDCGCFGEAIHLTNWQSLGKNLVLLPMSIVLFILSRRIPMKKCLVYNTAAAAVFAAFAAGIGILALRTLPGMDFASYKIGTDLSAIAKGYVSTYETVFTYEKDGVSAEFAIDSLPDDSWTFVDSRTTLVSGDGAEAMADISVKDLSDNYRNEIFSSEGAMIASVVWDAAGLSGERWSTIRKLKQDMDLSGVPFHLFCDNASNVPADLEECTLTSDRKALITLLRSNGGAVCINDGTISYKWPARGVSSESIHEILDKDTDMLIIDNSLAEKHYAMNVFGILAVLILIYISVRRMIYRKMV